MVDKMVDAALRRANLAYMGAFGGAQFIAPPAIEAETMAKSINKANLRTIISVAILVGTEIIAASLALGWALGGLLELSDTLRMILVGACLLLGVYVLYLFVRNANRVEPIRSE
jgi:hypothetical protein